MTVQEAYEQLFDLPMVEFIKTKPQELIDYLNSVKYFD